jgi:hypothetical protein
MKKRFLAWWRARRIRILHENARSAATVYAIAKARYENALITSEESE